MRRNEYDFLQAELLRLEGNTEEAKKSFLAIKSLKGNMVKNVLSLATHRLNYIRSTTSM